MLRHPASRLLVALAAVEIVLGVAPGAETAGSHDSYAPVHQLLSDSRKERRDAARRLTELGDRSLVPALVDAVFFTPRFARREVLRVLAALTGERHAGYYEWVEYVGAHEEIRPADGYLEWKASVLGRIDPGYRQVLYPGAPARIRLEEIISGGVRLAGIPSLDNPPTLEATEAGYLRKGERVFGVVVGGEARAYPVRILSWHEMLNDVVGGEPITLSFCTLCGSGIVYSTATETGDPLVFDTSGLLYRSNKLMIDRSTLTLWSNLTGEAVVGRLAQGPARLEMLPATLTTWGEWQEAHPETRVLDLKAIRRVGSQDGYAYDYQPGAADRARSGVSFPVWLESDRLERETEIYALRINGAAKAYPVDLVLRAGVVNDTLAGEPIVLVGDSTSGAVRAYRRGMHRFREAPVSRTLVDDEGRHWIVEELFLRSTESGPTATLLERFPGHQAFWFGWYAFFPRTEVYEGKSREVR